MEIIFEKVAYVLSIAAGVVSVITVIMSMIDHSKQKKSVIEKIESNKLDNVLKSDDINKLGNYLEQTLSEVSVYQYSKNPEVEKQFDRYLDKIKDYVGTTEEINREQIPEEPEHVEPEIGFRDVFPRLSREYNSVIDELNNGDPWNALARLRRNIELKLQEVAEQEGIKKKQRMSLRHLIERLHKTEVISGQAREKLDYAVSISNKAVHGIDVKFETASEAIAMAFDALQELTEA